MPRAYSTAKTVLAALIGLIMLAPFVYLAIGALSESFSLTTTIDLSSWQFTLSNFGELLGRAELVRPLLNSLIVAVVVTIGSLVFCTLSGYVLARRRFRGRAALMSSVMLVLMIPVHIVIIPLYLLTNWFGIFDTYLALILPFLVNPLGIFLMRQYITALPVELEEAARLEGASELTIIWRVVMPLCRPALAVLAVQVFLVNWNSFLYPFILTSSESLRTLPVALALLAGYQDINVPQLFAASLLSALPVTILFVIYSRRITEGIIAGALKG
ncbi:MAG: carbohydrate ABC transporter permease [bacterium]